MTRVGRSELTVESDRPQDASPRRPLRRLAARLDRMSEGRFAAVLAAPGLLLVALFVLPPVLAAIGLSFFRVELGKDGFTPFVALRNFVVRLPADGEFLGTLPLTLGFAAVTTAVAVPLGLAAAGLINGSRRFRGLLTVLLILPWAVAPIADGFIWRLMLEPNMGIVAKVLQYLGLPQVRIGQTPGALLAMLLAVTWRAVPLLGVLFLGALRQVPPDLGRAARLDGAGRFGVFRHVTLPAIAPIVIAASLLEIILTLQTFDIQFAMSNDNPPRGSALAGLMIYHTVIGDIALGYGAAQTMALGLFIAVCLFLLWALVIRPRRALASSPAVADDDLTAPPVRQIAIVAQPRPGGPVAPPLTGAGVQPVGPAGSTGPAEGVTDGSPPRTTRLVRRAGGRIAGWAAVVALATWLAAPILWVVIVSVQGDVSLAHDPPTLGLPLLLDGFRSLVADPAWQAAALVSVTVTTSATLLALAVALLTAYPLARYRLRGGRTLLLTLVGLQLIPPIALAIPILYIFIRLELRNSIPGLVLINAAFWSPILVFLVRGAFMAVPRNLDLAARIDGSSRVGVIFRVMLPAAAPAIAAAAAIVFVGIWNDFVFAAVLGGRNTYTLPRYLGISTTPSFHLLAVRIVLTILPCIAIIALLRRRIVGLV